MPVGRASRNPQVQQQPRVGRQRSDAARNGDHDVANSQRDLLSRWIMRYRGPSQWTLAGRARRSTERSWPCPRPRTRSAICRAYCRRQRTRSRGSCRSMASSSLPTKATGPGCARSTSAAFRGARARASRRTSRRFSEATGAAADGTYVARLRDAIERDRRTLVFDDPNDARLEGTAAKRSGAECGVLVPLTMGEAFVAGLTFVRMTPSPFSPDEVRSSRTWPARSPRRWRTRSLSRRSRSSGASSRTRTSPCARRSPQRRRRAGSSGPPPGCARCWSGSAASRRPTRPC